MTLEQLEHELPNGLHDAKIRSFTRDLENDTLVMTLNVLVGLPGDPPETRDAYRAATITFSGVKLFVVESPDASSAFLAPGDVSFSVERSEPGTFSPEIEKRLANLAEMYSFFILDWLSSIHIAASSMSFAWSPEVT